MLNKILLFLWVASVICVIVIFQTVLQKILDIRGIFPDLLLVFVVYSALNKGIEVGMVTGFFCGSIIDSLSLSPAGLNMLSMLMLGYFVGVLREKIYKDKPFNQILIVIISTIVYGLIITIFIKVFHSSNRNILNFLTIGIPEAIYNGAITLPVFYLLDKILPWKRFKPTIYGY
ncbi:MAG: rod shape-determining protein MreD [Candidatus Firestonebacteria bacterium]